MNVAEIVVAQYDAALDMLRQTIAKCPDSVWFAAPDKNPYWRVAYHALFYAHLYAQPTVQDFTPWAKHRAEYANLKLATRPSHNPPTVDEPYTQTDMLEYLDLCRQEVRRCMIGSDWEGASGFDWLPFSKLELQFYSIRHIQQHVGELSGALMAATGIEVNWVGTMRA